MNPTSSLRYPRIVPVAALLAALDALPSSGEAVFIDTRGLPIDW